MLKPLNSQFWDPKNFEFKGFNILESSVKLAGCCKLRFWMAPGYLNL